MPRIFAILIVSLATLLVYPGAKAETTPGQKRAELRSEIQLRP